MHGRSTLISHSKSVKHKKLQDEEKRSIIIASTIAMYFSFPKKGDAATKMISEPVVERFWMRPCQCRRPHFYKKR